MIQNDLKAYIEYMEFHKTKKTKLKVFLISSAMLQGIIKNYDDKFLILDNCLIPLDKIISIALL